MVSSPREVRSLAPEGEVAEDVQGLPTPPRVDRVVSVIWVDRVWSFLASQRLALILILLLAAASLIGVLLVQAPSSALADPGAYARWLTQVRPKYGGVSDLLSALGLLNVFGTWWFRLLLALLAANILVCTLNRGGTLLRAALVRPRVDMPADFFQRAKLRAAVGVHGLAFAQAEDLVGKALRRSGYQVLLQRRGEILHAVGDRNRFAPVGTLVHHLGLVALLAGFVIGGMWGYEDRGFVVAEGETRTLGTGGLAVRLDAFFDEYYPEGPPKDYRSHVTLFDQGREVSQATVRVNEPVIYNGVRLHQSFFGPAASMEVRDSREALLASETVPLAWSAQDRPVGSFVIPSKGVEVYVVGPASSFIDSAIPPGQVRLEVYRVGNPAPFVVANAVQGQPLTLGDLTYTFVRERQFSGFSVVQDPGRPVLWAAAIAIVSGLVWVLYFPHRRVWAMCRQQSDGSLVVRLGAASGNQGEFSAEFNRIAERIAQTAMKAGSKAEVVL